MCIGSRFILKLSNRQIRYKSRPVTGNGVCLASDPGSPSLTLYLSISHGFRDHGKRAIGISIGAVAAHIARLPNLASEGYSLDGSLVYYRVTNIRMGVCCWGTPPSPVLPLCHVEKKRPHSAVHLSEKGVFH